MSNAELRDLPDQTDWDRVRALTDEEIAAAVKADPDAAPLLDEETWLREGRRMMPDPAGKAAVSIRLDRQVLSWFKAQGPRYQSRINAVLRAYMNAHQRPRHQRPR